MKEKAKWFDMIDEFCQAMKDKLDKKSDQGVSGGDKKNQSTKNRLNFMLKSHVEKQTNGEHQEIDIANIAMMLWHQYGKPLVKNG